MKTCDHTLLFEVRIETAGAGWLLTSNSVCFMRNVPEDAVWSIVGTDCLKVYAEPCFDFECTLPYGDRIMIYEAVFKPALQAITFDDATYLIKAYEIEDATHTHPIWNFINVIDMRNAVWSAFSHALNRPVKAPNIALL